MTLSELGGQVRALPQDRHTRPTTRRPTQDPGGAAGVRTGSPRPRPADAAPTLAPGSARSRKNSATIVPCRATSAAACSPAAPARSPDPASPPSTPARKTRTAHPRDPAPPPAGHYVPPTLPAHRWLHAGRARRPGKTQPPQQMPSAEPEPAPSCSCTPTTTCTSGKIRRHKAVPLSAGETWQKDLNHRAEAPKGD